MQALKVLVVVMGVLIVAGVVVIAVSVINRMNAPAGRHDTDSAAPALRSFDSAALSIPHGCSVARLRPAGERLILQLGGGDGCGQILIVDMDSGRLLGRLDVVEAP